MDVIPDIPNDIKLIIAQQAHLLWVSETQFTSKKDISLSNEFLYGKTRGGDISYAVLERSITLQRAFTEGSDSSFKECYEFVSKLW